MQIKVILGKVINELNQFKSEEAFTSSPYYNKGWRIIREPSESIKELVKGNSKTDTSEPTKVEPVVELVNTTDEYDLEVLHKIYEEKTGKKVPPRYKCDNYKSKEWLNGKIKESIEIL